MGEQRVWRQGRSSLLTTDVVKATVKTLKHAGCRLGLHDSVSVGHILMMDGDQKAFMAIQKGRGGHWIASFVDTDRIKWQWNDNVWSHHIDERPGGPSQGQPDGPGQGSQDPLQ